MGSDDEDSFNESIEYTYVIELEILSSKKAIIKDVLDSMIHIIANENVSTNQSMRRKWIAANNYYNNNKLIKR